MSAIDPRGQSTKEMPDQPGPSRTVRIVQLDILRGIAILLVLLVHNYFVPPQSADVLAPVAGFGWRFGTSGVDLFFVLSGFLVGGLLMREARLKSRIDVWRFCIRRGFKIWPPYYVYIVWLVVSCGLHPSTVLSTVKELAPCFVHLQNYVGILHAKMIHAWSLAVEEHFYVLLPLLLAFLTRRSIRGLRLIPPIMATLAVACLVGRLITIAAVPNTELFQTHLRLDGLFWGVLLAYLYHFHRNTLAKIAGLKLPLIAAGLAFLALADYVSRYGGGPGLCARYTLLYLGYGCILVCMIPGLTPACWVDRLCATLPARVVAFVGYYSYSIYIWHLQAWTITRLTAPHICPPDGALGWVVYTLIWIGSAVGLGVVCSKIVEQPALALRERYFPKRAEAIQG